MSDRRPAEEFTLFEPLANAVNWVDIVGVHEGDVRRDPGPRPPGAGGARGGAGQEAGPGDPHRRGGRRAAPRRRQGDRRRTTSSRSTSTTRVAVVADLTGGAMADVVHRRRDGRADRAARHRPRAGGAAASCWPGSSTSPPSRLVTDLDRDEVAAAVRRQRLHAGLDGAGGRDARVGRGQERPRRRRGVRPRRHRRGHGPAGPHRPQPATPSAWASSTTPPDQPDGFRRTVRSPRSRAGDTGRGARRRRRRPPRRAEGGPGRVAERRPPPDAGGSGGMSGRSLRDRTDTGPPPDQYLSRMSTTKTMVSVPAIPASGLPSLP